MRPVVARHDYQPYGEEVGAGTGLRTPEQGYGAADPTRQRYAGTERDSGTGLDHTTWRKYETRAGRWTSPDPYGGSMNPHDPQSFNRYTYVGNDPANRVDPSGLNWDSVIDLLGFGPWLLDLPGFTSTIGNFSKVQEWQHNLIITYGFDPRVQSGKKTVREELKAFLKRGLSQFSSELIEGFGAHRGYTLVHELLHWVHPKAFNGDYDFGLAFKLNLDMYRKEGVSWSGMITQFLEGGCDYDKFGKE